jgi:hypothetical protein
MDPARADADEPLAVAVERRGQFRERLAGELLPGAGVAGAELLVRTRVVQA